MSRAVRAKLCEQRRALLVDQTGRFGEVALQLGFGLAAQPAS